jgi:hypothetical protein
VNNIKVKISETTTRVMIEAPKNKILELKNLIENI